MAVVAVLIAGALVVRLRSDAGPQEAQITGFSRAGTTSLIVAYVRGDDQRLVRAYADETASTVTLHVLVSGDPSQGASGTHPASYHSTTVALANPVGARTVVDTRGDAVVEQPPGIIPGPPN